MGFALPRSGRRVAWCRAGIAGGLCFVLAAGIAVAVAPASAKAVWFRLVVGAAAVCGTAVAGVNARAMAREYKGHELRIGPRGVEIVSRLDGRSVHALAWNEVADASVAGDGNATRLRLHTGASHYDGATAADLRDKGRWTDSRHVDVSHLDGTALAGLRAELDRYVRPATARPAA